MNRLYEILSKVPFLGILTALIAGILIGSQGVNYVVALPFFIIAIIAYFSIRKKSTNPIESFRLRNHHWIWILSVCFAIGLLTSATKYPTNIDLTSLKNFGYGQVSTISHKATGEQFVVTIEKQTNLIEEPSNCSPFNVLVSTKGCNVEIGDIVRIPLYIEEIVDSENIYDSNYADYMFWKGVRYKIHILSDELKHISHRNSVLTLSNEIRDNIIAVVEKSHLLKQTQNFIITILLGDKEYIDQQTRDAFAGSGIAHILALSGLHTGIISMLISFVLFPLSLFSRHRLKFTIIIIGIWTFVFISGMSPSVVRAAIMVSFYYLAKITEKQNNSFNALCAAGVVILTVSPFSLYDVGTHLSFTTVAAIIAFTDGIEFIDRHRHPIIYKIICTVMISIVATLGSWALTAYYFHKVPLLFLPLNLIAVPLLPFYLGISIFYIISSAIGVEILWIGKILDFFYDALLSGAEFISRFSEATIDIWLSPYTVLLYFITLIVFVVAFRNKTRILYLTTANLILITCLSYLLLPNDKPKNGFIVQKRTDSSFIRIYNNGTDTLFQLPADTTSFFIINNHRIVSVDNNQIGLMEIRRDRLFSRNDSIFPNFRPLKCDYLLLDDGYRGSLNQILRHYNPMTIVVMPTVYIEKQNAYQNELKNLSQSVRVHFIRTNGALRHFDK